MESKEKKQKTVKFSGHENQISSIVRQSNWRAQPQIPAVSLSRVQGDPNAR